MQSHIKQIILFFSFITWPQFHFAQAHSISLDSCYILAEQNYPLVKQYELIAKSNEYSVENITKGHLPQINIYGQATYQSDITELPKNIPGIPRLAKDQYNLNAEVSLPVYDGGVIREQKKIREAVSAYEKKQLEAELYDLKARINQLFFGILLIDGQLRQNSLIKEDIQRGLDKVNVLIANGAALKSEEDLLKAEWIRALQQTIELKSNRKAFCDMLSLFIHIPLDENSQFAKPPEIFVAEEINHPELQVFNYRKQILDAEIHLLNAKNRPKLGFFIQGGIGKPALDMFKNSLEPYYLGGLRLSVPLSGLYTLKNEKSLIQINKQNIDIRKETFLFNTRFALQQQMAKVDKLRQVLKTDDELISLRTGLKKASLTKLENGVINSNDYFREVNAEHATMQNKILHEIQLLIAQYSIANTTGN